MTNLAGVAACSGKAAFLGDSDFPSSALGYFKGGRIRLFQSLYMTYSRLSFTLQEDKPVALYGLEKRLVRTYGTKGGYGIFESYLSRALLWRRPNTTALTRIVYPSHHKVPSWSWMAYSGGIEYVSIEFGTIDWTNEVWSPFQTDDKQYWKSDENSNFVELKAMARGMQVDHAELLRRVTFDQPLTSNFDELRCVIIGREKRRHEPDMESTNWTLILRPLADLRSTSEHPIYERVGVGYLLSLHISEDKCEVRIR